MEPFREKIQIIVSEKKANTEMVLKMANEEWDKQKHETDPFNKLSWPVIIEAVLADYGFSEKDVFIEELLKEE